MNNGPYYVLWIAWDDGSTEAFITPSRRNALRAYREEALDVGATRADGTRIRELVFKTINADEFDAYRRMHCGGCKSINFIKDRYDNRSPVLYKCGPCPHRKARHWSFGREEGSNED